MKLVIIIFLINLFDVWTITGAILNSLNGTSSGWQVYPGGSYHYGPSILIDDNEDGLIHMWTCSPGTGSTEWDVIRYHSSSDNGQTWSPDEIALQPTSGSLDTYSACDPGVVKIDKYYYIGYTSTMNPNASQNQLFLARSLIPNGNYEKWNGSGWNLNNPQPIVAYHGPSIKYGIGEPSIILKDNLIYVYYTNSDDTGSFTDLSIAQLNSTNEDTWPLSLQYKGHIIKRRVNLSEDSTDIKWCPQLQLFIGVTTINRFSPDATVAVYQSLDQYGLQFQSTPYIGQRVQQGAHNIGLSGSTSGWIYLENQNHFVSYAYQPEGSGWGDWPTYLTPVEIIQLPVGTVIDGQVSSYYNWSLSGPFLWDHNFTTYWSSLKDNNEFVTINLGEILSIESLFLVPRPPNGYGFPIDFSIRASNDSLNFIHILDQHYSNYTVVVITLFSNPIEAQYLQVQPINYGTDEHGNKIFQLAEIYVQTH
jgi:hypothetical protein